MTRAVLFDFDQTLVDFKPFDAARIFRDGASRCYAYLTAHDLSLPAFESFVREQKWTRRKLECFRRLTGGEPDMRRVLRRLCRDYRLQRDQVSLAKLGWLWYEPMTEYASLAEDVVPTLRALMTAGIELGLVVNSAHPGAVIDQHLEDLGLIEFFPTRAYSTDIGASKPDARLFQAALQSMNVSANEAIFVGDQIKVDMLGAKRVGMTTVLRNTNIAARIGAADHIIRNLAELLDLPELARVRETKPTTAPIIPALVV